MARDVFDRYISEINELFLRGDATEHTHRPALERRIEVAGKCVEKQRMSQNARLN